MTERNYLWNKKRNILAYLGFFKWFLDNKAITVFLVTLLLGLNLFILSKISFLFFTCFGLFGSCDVASYSVRFAILFVESYC